MDTPFFDGWTSLYRTLIVGVLAYVALIAILRVSGKRTLSKMNAFDFVVTVAIGSTLSAAFVDSNVTLAECALALALLIGLQYLVSAGTLRSPTLYRLVRSDPTLLLYEGRLLAPALREQRVTESDVLAAVRGAGHADLARVLAVVLETDGSLSVIAAGEAGMAALEDVSERVDGRR